MTTSKPNLDWTIFTLPLEIRLLIYHFALTSPLPISLFTSPSTSPKTLVPALLLTCKRLHAEASHLLYTTNTFVIDTKWPSLSFLQTISRSNTALIRNLRLEVSTNYDGGRVVNHIHYTGPLWCELLKKLGENAVGLRCMQVYFAAERDLGGRLWGAGRDAVFFMGLARIRIGEGARMEIHGPVAVDVGCRKLLEERLGSARVVDFPGSEGSK